MDYARRGEGNRNFGFEIDETSCFSIIFPILGGLVGKKLQPGIRFDRCMNCKTRLSNTDYATN
nr:unnamed protein product [Callosobruchus analis]